jgi:hypothetical protein
VSELCCHVSRYGDRDSLFNSNFCEIDLYENISLFRAPICRDAGHMEPRQPAAVEPEPGGDTIRSGECMVTLSRGNRCSSGMRIEPTPRLSVLKVPKETARSGQEFVRGDHRNN